MSDLPDRRKILYFVMIIMGLLALLSILGMLVIAANAVTGGELSDIQDKMQLAKNQNRHYTNEMIVDRGIINSEYDKLIQLKIEKQQILQNPTWGNVDQIEVIDEKITEQEIKISELKKQYEQLKEKKENNKSNIKKLQKQYDELQIQYYNERQKALSGLSKVVGVRLDNTCMTLIKAGINNGTCPTYDELIQLDSSLKQYSGEFVKIDNITQREKAPYQNSWRYYDFDGNFRVIVDPPKGMDERIRMIEIRPNFDTYIVTDSMVQKPEFELVDIQVNSTYSWIKTNKTIDVTIRNQTQDYGRILFHDRFVDERCRFAAINAEKTNELLPDTIHHLRSGCSEDSTLFKTKEIIYPNYTNIDITTSQKYKDDQWLKYVKEFCIFKYKSCTG